MLITFISPVAWENSDGAQPSAQLAQELARRGHTVTFVEIEKSRTPVPAANPRVLTLQQLGWDDLHLVRAWYGFDYKAPPDAPARLLELLPNASAQSVLICAAPFRPALEFFPAFAARGAALVYEPLDDIAEMRALGSFCYDDAAEQYLVGVSELVVALSPRLREKFRAHPNVALIRDGVELAPFHSAAAKVAFEIQRGELTIGFWGTMWEYNLDLPLLQTVTRARPQWHWHFIGPYDLDPARLSVTKTLAAPNVHFHPSVSREMLAHAARSFDVCILPSPVTPFNLARDPLKVYEYLACYKPVVATLLAQLEGMPYVYLSRDADEFLTNIERAARSTMDHAVLDTYLSEQTWAKRTDALLAALETLHPAPRTLAAPPHGEMPGASQELDRWQAYARHLEALVRDREAHLDDLERALQTSGITSKLQRALGRSRIADNF